MSIKDSSTFTAIDFETANGNPWSICQIGLVRYENGEIVKEIDCLVRPPQNDYHWGNSRVHGIKSADTLNAPLFADVWHEMEPYVKQQLIVAHNADFDARCLVETLKYYQMRVPLFEKRCTFKIFKSNLKALCAEHNIPLNHHNALSDAKGCAQLYMIYLQKKGIYPNLFSQG